MTELGKVEIGIRVSDQVQGDSADAASAGADVIGILETLDVPIVVVGRDCTVIRFNRAAGETLGVKPSDIGRRSCDMQALTGIPEVEQTCLRVIADGVPSRHEIRFGDRWFLVRIAPYSGTDAHVLGAVLTFTNITAFRASLAQAIYEREYTKTILNSMADPLVVLDDGLRIQTANRAFYDLFGVSREQTQGVPFSDLGNDAWKASDLWSSLQATRSDGSEFKAIEFERDFPNVGRRTVLLDARRLVRDKSSLILLSFRDVTEAKDLELQREMLLGQEAELRKEAEAAARAKDRFIAVLSHELRTPLSPVVMTVATMERDPALPAAFQKHLAMIKRNVDLEVRLIDDLLDLNRATSGKMRFESQPTRVHEVLAQAIQTCAGETSAKKLNIHLDLQAADDLVLADPARLQQTFWNLLRNAAKFTSEGGSIFIRTESTHGTVRIEVRDTGIGIEHEFLPKVFDAFEQADANIARQFGGLGLGLAICKAIVETHGGVISAESDGPGAGATFTVELPIGSASEHKTVAAHRAKAERSTEHVRVLVVEDHADTREMLSKVFGDSNYAVMAVSSAETALALAATARFDIVVSDLGLPDGTGYDLMKQLRDLHGLKGIALSGYGMEQDQQRSRDAGFLAHVIKPVNVSELMTVIQRIVGN